MNIIGSSTHVLDLGVSSSCNCTFDFHISNLYKRCSNLAGWILRTFSTRDPQVMLTLYKSLVMSRLDYASQLLRGRQSVTSCRGVKSKARIVHTAEPQGSNMSPTLFSFYLADMTRPTKLVKQICYSRMGLRSQVTRTGAQDQRLPDRDVQFPMR